MISYSKIIEYDNICHTTSLESAKEIFKTNKLLSAVKARNLNAKKLQKEKRNAANDPTDYFDYIMFSWGNCQAGDRLVMERKLNRFPTEKDLTTNFTPGIRFYFKYDEIKNHPNAIIDGVLPLKIKDELDLIKWVHKIIIPSIYKDELFNILNDTIKEKIVFLDYDKLDIWHWSKKVYDFVKKI